ncbi:MAG: archaemetzincin family Zn-dependent metalloprotease [Candidatus Aenigmatarchaeota archaeon]
MEIDILPLENEERVPKTLLKELAALLVKRNIKTRLLKAEKIPKAAFDKARGQYDALIVLQKIDRRGVLAVTAADIFEDGLNFVYGLGDREGSAIVSTFRLRPEFYGEAKNEELLLKRLVKECMHEIGHTLGMKHCTRMVGGKQCAMTFSESIHEVDAKSDRFCAEHAKLLE